MLCSVIIPLYNKADFIKEAILSVLQQTYQNFEIIVVDDGSKDDGALRVKELADMRVKLIQQKNQGVSCARNCGIEAAQGDLVCFLDADDWYLPTYLETIVSMATRHPDIAFFATHYKRVKQPDQTTLLWEPGNTQECIFVDNLYALNCTASLFVTNSIAIRRNILNSFKPYFPPGEQTSEDLDLWFRLGEKYCLGYCPAALVGYRMDVTGSLCATYRPGPLLPVYVRIEQRALDQQMPEHLRQSALKHVAEQKISVARNALMNGERFAAFKQLLAARHALDSRRWWVSLAMCLVATPQLVQRWENWRLQRVQ